MPTLGGDRGIMSTLQQRHPGPIDLTPLHPILAAVKGFAPVQEHTTKTACTFTKFRQYGELVSVSLFFFLSFLDQANLRDTVHAYMYTSYQPRMTTWAKRRRT